MKGKITNYEINLIEKKINPKICILSDGNEIEYIKYLKEKFNADITILDSNFYLLNQEENQKDYDLIIYQTNETTNNFNFSYIAGNTATKYNKITSIIKAIRNKENYIIQEFIALNIGTDTEIEQHNKAKNLREIIDIGLENQKKYIEMIENAKNNQKKIG